MKYVFSLRVDDKDHSMTKETGLPIGELGGLLTSLSNAIGMTDSKAVLLDVHSNCVRYELMTNDEEVYSKFRIVHTNINNNSELDLTPSEREYANTLKKLMKKFGVTFEALDMEKKRIEKIREIKRPQLSPHYHESTTIYGKIIGFGGRDLDKPQMLVQTREGTKISLGISNTHEQQLSPHLSKIYKSSYLELQVQVRVSLIDSRREYTMLDYEIPQSKNLYESIYRAIEGGTNFFPDVTDSGEEIRKLRNNE